MKFLLSRKQHEIEKLIQDYQAAVSEAIDLFYESLLGLLNNSHSALSKEEVIRVHKKESRADDIRRDIESLMYGKALFPESREDIFELVKQVDTVPNGIEECLRKVYFQHIVIPEPFKASMKELLDSSVSSARLLLKSVDAIFRDFHIAFSYIGQIDQMESRADAIQYELIDRIFTSDIDGYTKILLRDLTYAISNIADRAAVRAR